MTTATASMIWDLSSYFPAFDGPEYRAHKERLAASLEQFGKDAAALGEITIARAKDWAALYRRLEEISSDFSHLSSYLSCLTAAHADNEEYRNEQAALSRLGAAFKKALVPLMQALRTATDPAFAALALHPDVACARYALERDRQEARWNMGPAREELAADLNVDGLSAWGRLYNAISGNLSFDVRYKDGRVERVPMAQRRSLLEDADPHLRREAHEGGNRAWEQVEIAAAACLNGLSGARLTLNKYRGVEHFFDVACFQSGVSRETVEVMFDTITKRRPMLQGYLRRKAELLGLDGHLGWQDLSAPLPLADSRQYPWPEAAELVLGAFGDFYPRLREFTESMLESRFVESEKRPNKRPGAFCTSSLKSRQSRVYMTYGGTLGDITTLAHEVGHAFHNFAMMDLRPLQTQYPMTLAETASTFAESILTRALLRDPGSSDTLKAQLLTALMDDAATYLLNIHMRFLFEWRFYEERQKGEVGVRRLKELVQEAQRECYGDAVDPEQLDPMFWASKLHFYITGVTFYNFPYTFGYLFSRGLFALAEREGPSFLPRYEELLRLTGSDTAENVAMRTLEVDLRQPTFWEQAIATIETDLRAFEEAAPRALGR